MIESVVLREIQDHGPTRVVINLHGEATTPRRALDDHDVEPTVIYIRDDGWSLGAPEAFEQVAANMWRDEWVAVLRKKPDGSWEQESLNA